MEWELTTKEERIDFTWDRKCNMILLFPFLLQNPSGLAFVSIVINPQKEFGLISQINLSTSPCRFVFCRFFCDKLTFHTGSHCCLTFIVKYFWYWVLCVKK